MSAEAESADADTDEEYDVTPQVTQHPHTIIVGDEITDVVTSATIDSDTEKTGHGVGVVWRNPTVAKGTLWRNRNVPEGFDSAAEYNRTLKKALASEDEYVAGTQVTQDEIDDTRERLDIDDFEDAEYGDYRLAVDYKVADPSDRETTVQSVEFDGEEKVTGIDVGGGSYEAEQVEAFDHDEVMVWYGGLSGQFILRSLDFHGMPFARYRDDGSLTKGLLDVPLGWKETDFDRYPQRAPSELEGDDSRRGELARSANRGGYGRAPRVARPPVLRPDIEGREVFIEIERGNGDSVWGHTAFNDFEDDNWEEATPLGLRYHDPEEDDEGRTPEEVIEEAFDADDATDVYGLYHGEGWQPDPSQATLPTTNEGASFDVDVDDDEEVSHPTEAEVNFAENVAENIAGTGANPDDDIFNVEGSKTDLEGLVAHNAEQFDATPSVDAIREVVYENVSHLDTDDL